MKSKIMSFIKKQWLLVWSVFVVMCLSVMFVSAEYSLTTSTMKRVVRSTSEQGKMFSSNILAEGTPPYVPKYKSALNEGEIETGTYDVDVYLWNYNLGNLAKQYPKKIKYSVTFELAQNDGSPFTGTLGSRTIQIVRVETDEETDEETDASIAILSQALSSYTLNNEELSAGTADQNHYKLKFSGNWDLEKDTDICVKVTTKLDENGDYQDLVDLGAVIGLKQLVDYGESGWDAYISEDRGGKTPSACDAYNLIVTGSGKNKITIKWDTRYIDCNKNFWDDSIYTFGKYIDETEDNTNPENPVYTYSDARTEVSYSKSGNIATIVINGDTGGVLVSKNTSLSGMDHDKFLRYSVPSSTEGQSRLENRNRYDIQLYKIHKTPEDDLNSVGWTDPEGWSFFSTEGGDPSGAIWITVSKE